MEKRRDPDVPQSFQDLDEHDRSQGPAWATRLKELVKVILSSGTGTDRHRACGEAWLILNAALTSALRRHSLRFGRVGREDLEEIAAQRSLDLLTKIEEAKWDPTGHTSAETATYLSRVARNALVDWLRTDGRWVRQTTEGNEDQAVDWPDGAGLSDMSCLPDEALESQEFAQALVECVNGLKPRARRIWFLRVFCDLSSKEIAVHPAVVLKPSHVDVVLQRCRQILRDCMQKQGYQLVGMPTGVFVAIWENLQTAMVDFASG